MRNNCKPRLSSNRFHYTEMNKIRVYRRCNVTSFTSYVECVVLYKINYFYNNNHETGLILGSIFTKKTLDDKLSETELF